MSKSLETGRWVPPSGVRLEDDGHVWHEKVFSSMQIKCCMNCGFIKNDRGNKVCPGPVMVGLRCDQAFKL